MTPAPQGFVSIMMTSDAKGVMSMLTKLQVSLSPVALAGWMDLTIDPYIRTRAKNRFRDEGDDVSGPWEPLLGVTQYIRASQGFGAAHPINHRTGQLENFITGIPGGSRPNALGATYTHPKKAPQGLMHTKVKTAQRGKISPNTPPRPVLGVNERDLLSVLTDLSLYLGVGQMFP